MIGISGKSQRSSVWLRKLCSGLGVMERFDVERKAFQVKFVGINGGMWISITKRSQGFVVLLGFGKEELDWLLEHLKKTVELGFQGFYSKDEGQD